MQAWAKRRTKINIPLSTASAQWSRLNREWRNIGGILQVAAEDLQTSTAPCLCFSENEEMVITTQADWDELFTFPALEAEPVAENAAGFSELDLS